jgi:hypothetical protein
MAFRIILIINFSVNSLSDISIQHVRHYELFWLNFCDVSRTPLWLDRQSLETPVM